MLFEYETDRLVLQVLKPTYAPMVLDFFNRDKELFEKYEIDRVPDFYTVKYQQKVLKYEYNMAIKKNLVRFYVFLKSDPSKIIGTVCLHNISSMFYCSCEVGYKFSSEFHHQGYAQEAIKKCLEIAFFDLNLHRVTAIVNPGNQPSLQLLNRLNFKQEGLLRDYLLLHGVWTDHALLALTKPEFT